MHFSSHRHEQFLAALHHNVLSASPSMGVWALSTSIQLKIRLLPQVFDVAFDQFRQCAMSDIDPVVNRPDEAVTLGGKGPTLFILQEELHHGKVMHCLCHECGDLRLVEVRTSTREHLPEGLTVLVGSMDLNGVAPHVNLVI